MRIMITGAGGPAAISIWKSLYPQHELHMADMDPCAAGLYLVPAAQRLIVPRGDSPEFVGSVQEACRVRGIEMLLSTVDAELVPVAEAASSFEAGGTRVPLSPVETLRLCRDKYLLLEHLKHAVPVPEFGLLSAATLDQALVFPLFAKTPAGRGLTWHRADPSQGRSACVAARWLVFAAGMAAGRRIFSRLLCAQ